jgi:hypothetical protein
LALARCVRALERSAVFDPRCVLAPPRWLACDVLRLAVVRLAPARLAVERPLVLAAAPPVLRFAAVSPPLFFAADPPLAPFAALFAAVVPELLPELRPEVFAEFVLDSLPELLPDPLPCVLRPPREVEVLLGDLAMVQSSRFNRTMAL